MSNWPDNQIENGKIKEWPEHRRARVDLMTRAEQAIREAMIEVEKVGADVRLTDSVVLLSAAQTRLQDYLQGVPGHRTFPRQEVIG